VPHTFIQTPNMAWGFYPAGVLAILPGPAWGPGEAIDNSDYVRTKKMTPYKYKACPETIRELEKSMIRNAKGAFNPVNVGGNNCTGWACARLEEAGFTPPSPSWMPYLTPWTLPKQR
ncbi:MAG: hypothetical protein ACREBD_29090, partial [Blastocatellia bacterium]